MQNATGQALHQAGRAALRVLYPPQCVTCEMLVAEEGMLCPACWREMPFIDGLCCDACGLPLPGTDPGTPVHCERIALTLAPPMGTGLGARAALLYKLSDKARPNLLSGG